MLSTPAQRYDTLSRSLHWLMAAIIVASWALIRVKGWFPKGSEGRESVSSLHEQLGIALLLLLALRLPWRWSHPASPVETPAPAWTQAPALLAKIALYALMFALPLFGIAAVQAHGESVTFLGFTLPDLFKSFASRDRTVNEIHEWMGDAIMMVVGLHAAAALWHHFMLRDGTLLRMLGRRKASAPE
jgi:superoxide oxidase